MPNGEPPTSIVGALFGCEVASGNAWKPHADEALSDDEVAVEVGLVGRSNHAERGDRRANVVTQLIDGHGGHLVARHGQTGRIGINRGVAPWPLHR